MRLKTLESKIGYRISRSKDNAFVLRDFLDLSDRDQVMRVMRKLIKEQKLIKLGQGIYAKTRYSNILNKTIPAQTLPTLAKEAMLKFGVKSYPSSADNAYNQGRSTQVPTGRLIGVKQRFSRRIAYDGWEVEFERVS